MTSNPNERSENFSVGETARLRLSNIRGPARPTPARHPAGLAPNRLARGEASLEDTVSALKTQ